jgi:YbbR domain-containing protein
MSERSIVGGKRQSPQTQPFIARWLHEIFVHDLGLKLLALAITLGLWYAVTGQRFSTTVRLRGIPLNFRVANEMEISNEPGKEFIVTLSGNKGLLDHINPRDLVGYVDATSLQPGRHVVVLASDTVSINLPEGIKIEGFEPNRLSVEIEGREERLVDVEAKFGGHLPEGYEIEKVTVSPEQIHVRGPLSRLGALRKIMTVPISLDGHTESFSSQQTSIDLGDPKLSALDSLVNIQVEVEEKRIEKTIVNVPVVTPSGRVAQPSRASITVYGRRTAVEALVADRIRLVLSSDSTGKVIPRLEFRTGDGDQIELRSTKPSNFIIPK